MVNISFKYLNVSVKMPFLLTTVDVYSRYLSVYLLPTKKKTLLFPVYAITLARMAR